MCEEAVEIGTSEQAQGETGLVSTAVKLLVYKGTIHGLLKKTFSFLLPYFNILTDPSETPAGPCSAMPCLALCALGVFLQPPPLVACHLGLAGCSWARCHRGDQQGSGDTPCKRPRVIPGNCSARAALGPTPCVAHILQKGLERNWKYCRK